MAIARRTMRDRELGWPRIPARRVDRLFDEELRALELDENTERVTLNDSEASKLKLAEIHQAEAEEQAMTCVCGRPELSDKERIVQGREWAPVTHHECPAGHTWHVSWSGTQARRPCDCRPSD